MEFLCDYMPGSQSISCTDTCYRRPLTEGDPPSDYITTLFYYETICIQPYLSIFLFSLMLLNSGAVAASLTVCTCCSSQRVWRPIPLFSWQLRSDNLNMTKMLQSRSDCYQLRGTKFRMFVQIHTLTHRRQL